MSLSELRKVSGKQLRAIHAGLECGILGINYPEMNIISFGSNIYGAFT